MERAKPRKSMGRALAASYLILFYLIVIIGKELSGKVDRNIKREVSGRVQDQMK